MDKVRIHFPDFPEYTYVQKQEWLVYGEADGGKTGYFKGSGKIGI